MANSGIDKNPMTFEGKARLEAELKRLITIERPSVIKAIEEAREHGDISENAEYESAKERQGLIEGRIGELQSKISTAEVIDPAKVVSDRVVFGATVTLVDLEEDAEIVYQIVGVDEADVKVKRISILSPLARALIGKKAGDVVTVNSPKGDREYEIKKFVFK